MIRMKGVRSLWLLLLLAGVSLSARANYLSNPDAQHFIDMMVSKHGFSRFEMERWMANADRKDSILEAISRPAEKVLEWKDYRKIFLTSQRIRQGRAFLEAHKAAFDREEAELGVSRYIVAAIIGVETRYGHVDGNYRVIDALSTLAFDYPPRSAFFRRQLEQYFLMTREQHFNPLSLTGSYAGAMGYGQFIPSSYRDFAIDFDGDKVADIFDNPVDAIGSVANYFHKHSWQYGSPVADQVQLDAAKAASLETDGLKPTLTMADFRKAGVDPSEDVAGTQPTRLITLQGEKGAEYWLTYHNFYVITRYNHSPLYAMAVYQLAQALAD
ncbi:lytic murein transglycosylase B [Mangrovitalea sediminis]|uniref:lytic murein transglycosylase B n=1 Tax=Mangrovitalea sediminis TaxID=1982043 RepID=UPI001D0CFE10|nr:lytic murein transglycosylase B [Mangrovitalea sediminis]